MRRAVVVAALGLVALAGCSVPSAAVVSPVAASPAAGGERVTVQRVVDGDTVVLTDGRRVRLLGIDSCEMNTPGGHAAQQEARALLPSGTPVTLGREPGVDVDRYDRLLRYVVLPDGRDFGLVMVAAAHTGVYRDGGDAGAGYVAGLRAADRDGRACG